jgi:3-hydroxyacyl-CoA dehydrogenase
MGLVELGVGVIPAGGGCTNLLGRWVGRLPDDPAVDPLPMLRKVFEAIGMAKVSFSAEEARDLGYLRESDGVTLGRDRLLADAKQTVLGLARAGYRRPRPRYFRLPGESGAAAFEWFLYNLKIAGNISEHDEKIGKKLARILTGGTTSTQTPVSEAHILELEREVFLSLCGERKTQERMQYMLMNGKPLRN